MEEPPKTGPISPACYDFVGKRDECYGPLEEGCYELYLSGCQQYLEDLERESGVACAGAVEDWYACIGEFSCKELMQGACEAEATASETACNE